MNDTSPRMVLPSLPEPPTRLSIEAAAEAMLTIDPVSWQLLAAQAEFQVTFFEGLECCWCRQELGGANVVPLGDVVAGQTP